MSDRESVTTENGARATWLRGLFGVCLTPILLASAQAGNQQPERVWSHELTGESYSAHTIAIGHHGTQVFCDTGYLDPASRLYSSFDESGSIAWERRTTSGFVNNRVVSSSETGDVHASWRQEYNWSQGQSVAQLIVFDSSSTDPVIEYEFDQTQPGQGLGYCSVSDDGRWVLAATSFLGDVQLARFDTTRSNPNIPVFETEIDHWGYVNVFDASSDGSRFYIGGSTSGTLVDMNSGQVIYNQYYYYGGEIRGHSLSGDGRTVAAPEDDDIRIFRESGGNNVMIRAFDPFPGTDQQPWETAISEDGQIVAAAYAVRPNYNDYHVFAWRVSDGQQLLNFQVQGSGTLENTPEILELSASGHRLVVGATGDSLLSNPEIRVFQLNATGNQYGVQAQFSTPGSILAMDLSADGEYLAVSGLDTHVEVAVGSKVIALYRLGSNFTATGKPRETESLTFEYSPPGGNAPAFLLVSNGFDPMHFSIGTLFPDRHGLQVIPMTPGDTTGTFELEYSLVGSEGSVQYFQGYALDPRILSSEWLPVTVLP